MSQKGSEETVQAGSGGKAWRVGVRAVVFAVLAILFIYLLARPLIPSYDTRARANVEGIYGQPHDSVQVLALGASTIRRSVSPDELFEDYGISAWNSCSSNQPTIASYYLLQDVLRSQSGSLSLVVMDAQPLLTKTEKFAMSSWAEMIAARMQPSPVKLRYIWDMTREYDDLDLAEELIPVLRYHSRWNELEGEDFSELPGDTWQTRLRGWAISFVSNAKRGLAGKYSTSGWDAITDEIDADEDTLTDLRNGNSMKYFDKIVAECKERGIGLLLVKAPKASWSDEDHDAVTLIAEEYGVDFLDLNSQTVWDECGLSFDNDFYDEKHPNVIGGPKLSKYIGKFLIENYDLDDHRGDSAFDFMEGDMEEARWFAGYAELMQCDELDDYLTLLSQGRSRYTVFAAVRGEAADGLEDVTREKLADLGFAGLASLASGGSYVGVVDGGRLAIERADGSGGKVSASGSYEYGHLVARKASMQDGAVFDSPFTLTSVGADSGAAASVKVEGSDRAEDGTGVVFAVYDRDNDLLVDTSCFDTHDDCSRRR